MPSDRALLERQMAEVELRPFTIDQFHHRRHRKQRNRRIATVAIGLVLVVVLAGSVLQALSQGDEKVESDVVGPQQSLFEGSWTASDIDGSSQTMEIRRTAGNDYVVVLRDDSAGPCSGGPSTETGSGRVQAVTELVTALELTCDEGITPSDTPLAYLTFVYEPETGDLTDNIGVLWHRPGSEPTGSDDASAVLEGPSPFEGSWVSSGVAAAPGGQDSIAPESLEIRRVPAGDAHETEVHQSAANRCSGAPATLTGTGRRRTQPSGRVDLETVAALTCDDGSTPVPQPGEEDLLDNIPVTYVYDPVTDELADSLGTRWWREGSEPK